MRLVFLLLVFAFIRSVFNDDNVEHLEFYDLDSKVYWNSPQAETSLPSIAMPPQGVLGVDKLYTPYAWPIPAVSPTGITNMYILSNSTCSTNSAFRGTFFNCSIQYPFTCNGLQAYILPYMAMAALDGFIQPLVIPRFHQNNIYLNGNFIQVAAGVITTPPRCAGGILFEVVIYLANSQYQCVTTGVNGHKIIYQLKLITGNCQSTCWLTTGNTLLNPPVNNLGAVSETGPEPLPEEQPLPEPYPEKPEPSPPLQSHPEKPYQPPPPQPPPPQSHPERPHQPPQPPPPQSHPERPYHPGPPPQSPPQSHPERPYYPAPPQSHPEKPYYPAPPQSHPEKPYYPGPPPQSHPEKPYYPPPPPPTTTTTTPQPHPERPYYPAQPPPPQSHPEMSHYPAPPPQKPQSYPEKPYLPAPPPSYPEKPYAPPPQSHPELHVPQLPPPQMYPEKPYLAPPKLPYPEKPYGPPQQSYPEQSYGPPQQSYPEKPYAPPQQQSYPELSYEQLSPYPNSYPKEPYPSQAHSDTGFENGGQFPELPQHDQMQGFPAAGYPGQGWVDQGHGADRYPEVGHPGQGWNGQAHYPGHNYQGGGYPKSQSRERDEPSLDDGESYSDLLPQLSDSTYPEQLFPDIPHTFP